ncbi:HD-GYP domain-containing protein [Acidovorax radicis]|uniref:HD-GYP domain-containing protein n=1 Tax=Acidovorax radicis TaxID=758826 RepID=UPI001CF841F9|nr:HD domain-containing phosphohydrolase [Acidovorax radicis]UCU98162.1 HD domain-containing protein [Acidovorax radicis]
MTTASAQAGCPLLDGNARCFDEAAAAQMERFVSDFGRMYCERNEALREVTRAHHAALFQLSAAADLKDDDTGVHIVRIGYLAEALALFLGQSPDYARMLRKAAPMHDIGKIGIPDSVLKKPGPLTADERQSMNRHAAMGAEILGRSHIPVFLMAAELALTHHERYDGGGYPAGLAGDAIPLSGRITAVVDFFDAVTMDRVYRPAFTVEQALEMLSAERGKAFDPHVVDVFLAHAHEINDLRCKITRECPSFDALIDSL